MKSNVLAVSGSFGMDVQPEDTVFVQVFGYSMRFATLGYLRKDGAWSGATILRDSIAIRLLGRLYGSNEPRSDSGLCAVYASVLVAGESEFAGFPRTSPSGLDTGKVRNAALRQAVACGKSLTEIVARWNLDLDYTAARSRILALEPRISASDSIALFR